MKLLFVILLVQALSFTAAAAKPIRVGSKAFTEGYLTGELAAQKIESTNTPVIRKFGLGGTGIVYQALLNNEIDVYPEYTGTIAEAILNDSSVRDAVEMKNRLAELGLVISNELGFENTYALAVRREFAAAHNLKKISDLKGLEEKVRAAFSHEFMSRNDGLKSLERVYELNFGRNLQSIDHSLAYRSISEKSADLVAVYSTDDKIETLDLVILEDDRKIFPPYRAVYLAKNSFAKSYPFAWAALNELAGTIDEETMRMLNGKVERDRLETSEVIAAYLGKKGSQSLSSPTWRRIKRRTGEHLTLVSIALFVSVLAGIPMGILAARYNAFGQVLLLSSAVVQTIPSLALLCLLIPFFGIGMMPALVALCLYSLLPVVLNTLIGLQSIDRRLIETAQALGLPPTRILFSIELPLASRSILGGVRTAAIIGIGTATLAALIGAGGYGAPIISGLATNNMSLILTGAIPCAVMALLCYAIFEIATRVLVPRGLRR